MHTAYYFQSSMIREEYDEKKNDNDIARDSLSSTVAVSLSFLLISIVSSTSTTAIIISPRRSTEG